MTSFIPRGPAFRIGFALLIATHPLVACGGRSSSVDGDDDAHSGGGTSGSSGATGGNATGGTDIPGKGGATTGGTAGDAANGGTGGPTPDCAAVDCAPLPATCKQIVQPPNACCPICKDPGCPPCVVPTCPAGYHTETLPGDCCASCVPDPANACEQAQSTYIELRQALLDKYALVACTHRSDCTVVVEDNACLKACEVGLPTSTLESYASNLAAPIAACASCPPPHFDEVCLPFPEPACVNGLCVAVGGR